MDRLDPAPTALVMIHMVKGVAGDVDTPFNRMFRHRAEETGIIKVQARTIVVSDACTADSDESHARALEVLQKWFGETPTADEVLSALG